MSDSRIQIGMDLDASGVERSAARAEKAVDRLRSRAAAGMAQGGGDAGASFADGLAKHGPKIFAIATSIGRAAASALESSGQTRAASFLAGATQGAVQLGAALSPLGPAAMLAGAGFGALSGALSSYFDQAKRAREETERLAKAQKAIDASDVLGDFRGKRDRERLGTAGGLDEARKRLAEIRQRNAELGVLAERKLATPEQLAELRQGREDETAWGNTVFRAERSQATGDALAKYRADEERAAADARDAARRRAMLAMADQPTLSGDDRHRVAMAGAGTAQERLAILERRDQDLVAVLRHAISKSGGEAGFGQADAAFAARQANLVEIEMAKLDAKAEQKAARKRDLDAESKRELQPRAVDQLQGKGWGVVDPTRGLADLAREQRDLLRAIRDTLAGGARSPAAVYAR